MAKTLGATGTGAEVYRRLALALPDTVESSHMGAADFRIQRAGKERIFATLAYAAKGLGTLMLDPAEQGRLLAEAPQYFSAAPGGWGRMGATLLRLDAPKDVMAGALITAHRHVLARMTETKRRAATKRKS